MPLLTDCLICFWLAAFPLLSTLLHSLRLFYFLSGFAFACVQHLESQMPLLFLLDRPDIFKGFCMGLRNSRIIFFRVQLSCQPHLFTFDQFFQQFSVGPCRREHFFDVSAAPNTARYHVLAKVLSDLLFFAAEVFRLGPEHLADFVFVQCHIRVLFLLRKHFGEFLLDRKFFFRFFVSGQS